MYNILQIAFIASFTFIGSAVFAQGNTWKLSGNNNVNANSFIGSENNAPLIFKTNNNEVMRLTENGEVNFMPGTNINLSGNANIDSIYTSYINATSLFAAYIDIQQADIYDLSAVILTSRRHTADSLLAGYFSANTLTTPTATIETLIALSIVSESVITDTLIVEEGEIDHLNASQIITDELVGNNLQITTLNSNTASISKLNADSIDAVFIQSNDLISEKANINRLNSDSIYTMAINNTGTISTQTIIANYTGSNIVQADTLESVYGNIDDLHNQNITTETLIANSSMIQTLTTDSLTAIHINTTQFDGETAQINSINTNQLDAERINAIDIAVDSVISANLNTQQLNAENGEVQHLEVDSLVTNTITNTGDINTTTVNANNLIAQSSISNSLLSDSAHIEFLDVENFNSTSLFGQNANFQYIHTDSSIATTVITGVLKADTISANTLSAANGDINNLNADSIHTLYTSSDYINSASLRDINNALIQTSADGNLQRFEFSGDSTQVLRGDGTFGADNNHWFTSGDVLFNNNTGNVGIGTSNPIEKLHVAGNIKFDGQLKNSIFQTNPTDSTVEINGDVNITNNLTTNTFTTDKIQVNEQFKIGNSIVLDATTSSTGAANRLFTSNTAPTELFIQSESGLSHHTIINAHNDGNVGIGLTNPSEKLHLAGNFRNTGTLRTGSLIFNATGSENTIIKTGTEHMYILNGDNENNELKIGLGTDHPEKALHIRTYHRVNNAVTHYSHEGIRMESHYVPDLMTIGERTSTTWDIEPEVAQMPFLSFGLPDEPKMVIRENGSVGIGNTITGEGFSLDDQMIVLNDKKVGLRLVDEDQTATDHYGLLVDINENENTKAIVVREDDGHQGERFTVYGNGAVETREGILAYENIITKESIYADGLRVPADTDEDVKFIIKEDGTVGIGTNTPQSLLSVNGEITCKGIEVTANGWPDYVFYKDYNLLPLDSVKNYINQNGHLPDVPSEKTIEKNGINLGEMDAILLRKIEELTLYMIELKKENAELKRAVYNIR